MKPLVLSAVTAVVLVAQSTAQAQPGASCGYGSGYSGYGYPYYVYPRYHASTAAEGYLRGWAAATWAQGHYNRLTAEAWIAAEHARGLRIQNRELAADTYVSMREANRQARARERGPRVTAEQVARLASSGRPDPLSPDELDPQNGRISWPVLLQAEEYDLQRGQLAYLFARRAASGRLGADELAQVQQISQTMLATLKGQVREVPPMEYTTARKFIERLAYAARQPLANDPTELAMAYTSH